MITKEELGALWNFIDKGKKELKVINPKTLRYSTYVYYAVGCTEERYIMPSVEKLIYCNFLRCIHMGTPYMRFAHSYTEIIDIEQGFTKGPWTGTRTVKICSYLPEYNTCRKYKVT